MHSQVPVIMLTAFDSEDDKVRGLDLGADDYLAKPFSHRELVARIRATLRRTGIREVRPREDLSTRLQVGALSLDAADHSVIAHGQPVGLAPTEFRLLQCLMANAGHVVSTQELLKQVWGYTDPVSSADVVRVTAHRLRHKIEQDPRHPQLLHTIAGVGILLKPSS
jgi:two-component system response regulator RegX3